MLSEEMRKVLTDDEINWLLVFTVGSSGNDRAAAQAIESLASSRLACGKMREAAESLAKLVKDEHAMTDRAVATMRDHKRLIAEADQLWKKS